MAPPRKKTFRAGEYYASVWLGKRTIKEGECAAIWTASGKRKVVTGPQRKRLWFSHVRFLDRYVADPSQYLSIQHRDGRKEHCRGPLALFFDPCVHEKMEVVDAFKLAANEALVVYQECPVVANVVGSVPTAAVKVSPAGSADETPVSQPSQGLLGGVERRIVKGPAVYIPDPNEWVHNFSWHGTPNKMGGKGSITGSPGDEKKPHALNFQKLRLMPDQMYYSVKDVRTSDDAQITIHLMLFYELADVEKMLGSTNDPIGDFCNATSADVMQFGASNTYASLLQNTAELSKSATFPTLKGRMSETGYKLIDVVYRGYSTSHQLQAMHDDAIAKRTKLRLQSDTAEVEQADMAIQLRCKQDRSKQEQELSQAETQHKMSLLSLQETQKRREKDADHAQELRHKQAASEADIAIKRACNEEELRKLSALAEMGVDLTKFLCASAAPLPDQHLRIDSISPATVHVDAPQKRK